MSDDLKFPDAEARADREPITEPLLGLIRDAYAAPTGAAGADEYWASLEQRIMSRIAAEGAADGRWWTVLAPWARYGLAAAAAIFAIAGLVNREIVEADDQYAYEAIVDAPSVESLGVSQEFLLVQDPTTGNEAAALRYYISN